MTSLVSAICESAAHELNLIMPGESLNPNDGARLLRKLNAILDDWNAKRQAIYAVVLATYTLTPTLQPHTIGPTGATWTATQRPVSLETDPDLIIDAATDANTRIRRRDVEWWNGLGVPTLQSSIPTDVFYNPTWPNGSFYFYPVPTTAYEVTLTLRTLLSNVVLTDTIDFPQGYLGALEDTLIEHSAASFGRAVPDGVEARARMRRAAIFANNDVVPEMATMDAGMPSGTGPSTFSYLTRDYQ